MYVVMKFRGVTTMLSDLFSKKLVQTAKMHLFILSISLGVMITFLGCSEQMPTSESGQSSLEEIEGTANSNSGKGKILTATVELHPVDSFWGAPGISGEVTIVDDGESIEVVSGSATNANYVSAFYGKSSGIKGKHACSTSAKSILTYEQKKAATWEINSNGQITPVDIDGEYVPIGKIGAISLQTKFSSPNSGGSGIVQPAPPAVVACGEVKIDPQKGNN